MFDDEMKIAKKLAHATPDLCGCGTCQEAIDTGVSMFQKNMEYQCPIWMLQVAQVLTSMAQVRIMQEAIDKGLPGDVGFAMAVDTQQKVDRVIRAHMALQYKELSKQAMRPTQP